MHLYWGPDWTESLTEIFREQISLALESEKWVIDGELQSGARHRLESRQYGHLAGFHFATHPVADDPPYHPATHIWGKKSGMAIAKRGVSTS